MARLPTSDLDILYRYLASLPVPRRKPTYRVPSLWDCWGYGGSRDAGRAERFVHPHRFALECLERILLPARGTRRLARRSLSASRVRSKRKPDGASAAQRGGEWIRRANIYSMFVRLTSAWDHNADGSLRSPSRWTETGTFLKSLLLLPHLARMGINTIYLLPICKVSHAFRKGEVGCPYASKNFFELDPDLHDRLLCGDGVDVNVEFGAFVEAAHAMDMRVMIDLAPRTAARDSDLILDHPDWFYWIDAKALRGYGAPYLEGIKSGIPPASKLADILTRDVLKTHLRKFRHSPSVTSPARWRTFAADCKRRPPRDLLGAIRKHFGVITPPGFSDCINDPQPPWSDVTFLRLFLDHPAASVRHLEKPAEQPPYAFTDTIKASRFPGRKPNMPLWKRLSDILPFYQQFGVDGARVDMGHALPAELQAMLMAKPRRIDPDFSFLAEELGHENARHAKRDGYNAIIGAAWHMEPRYREGLLHKFVHETLATTALPALAAAETSDTPRAAVRAGGEIFARLMAVLNYFLPSGLPMINTGLEVLERQPMNLGLDAQPGGQFVLPKRDPFYGKLAFFDRARLHWCNKGADAVIEAVGRAAAWRERFIDDLVNPRNYFAPTLTSNKRSVAAVGWKVNRGRSVLIVAANLDFDGARRTTIGGWKGGKPSKRAASKRAVAYRRGRAVSLSPRLLFSLDPAASEPKLKGDALRINLAPGDVQLVLLAE